MTLFIVELIVDAGIIFTGLIGTGVTKNLLFSKNLRLFAPEFLFDVLKNFKEIFGTPKIA